jgi:hypothetical protein
VNFVREEMGVEGWLYLWWIFADRFVPEGDGMMEPGVLRRVGECIIVRAPVGEGYDRAIQVTWKVVKRSLQQNDMKDERRYEYNNIFLKHIQVFLLSFCYMF